MIPTAISCPFPGHFEHLDPSATYPISESHCMHTGPVKPSLQLFGTPPRHRTPESLQGTMLEDNDEFLPSVKTYLGSSLARCTYGTWTTTFVGSIQRKYIIIAISASIYYCIIDFSRKTLT